MSVLILVCSSLCTNFFLNSKFVHEFCDISKFEFRMQFFSSVLISYTKFVIYDRTSKNLCEFVKVMLQMACTVLEIWFYLL